MAKRRLTFFSRMLIALAITAAIFFGGKWLIDNTGLGEMLNIESTEGTVSNNDNDNADRPANRNTGKKGDVINVGVVDWVGYAGGQYFNEGFEANKNSRYYKDYGFQVDFQVINDPEASLAAWKRGDLDLHWFTLDAFPTIYEGIKDYDPVILFQADWSRGGDAIVARRGINNVADLKGKKVAVAERTPSHSFLLWLLDAGGLTQDDIEIIPTADAIQAGDFFKGNQVDAAVTWSPTDEECVRVVPGARILESTRSASNIIADIFFAKREYVEANRDKLQQLYEGWMIGAAELENDDDAKQKAINILAEGLGYPAQDILIDNAYHTTHGDNLNFFGLNADYKGVTANSLYQRMAQKYAGMGYAAKNFPSWRSIAYPNIVQRTKLEDALYRGETKKEFTPVSDQDGEAKEAIATKRVSINFRTGEFQLDENAKYIIDLEFVDIAKAFGNARIRIEGNTDNVGNRASNVALSKKRAQSVKDYLVKEHDMDPNRFIVIGNGPDSPVADNSTADGKAKNRRTDFELVRD
ncbi:MAG: phosphate ABC transporter substrate-binding/OmpA family protein [Bacteroidota bacterium]